MRESTLNVKPCRQALIGLTAIGATDYKLPFSANPFSLNDEDVADKME